MFRQCRQRDDRRFAKEVFGTPGGQHPSGPRSHPVLGTSFMQGSEQGCLLPRAACRVAWGQRLCWPDFQLFDIPFLTRQCKCSNYHTVALISLSSKVMLKSLQARLQQYVNCELPDVQTGFRKGRGTRDQIANIRWIIKKAREFQKNIHFCFIDYAKAFHCVWITINWKFLKERGIPDHLTCLLKNLYADQEATVRTGHGTTDWFQIKEYVKAVYCHPAYLIYMQSTSWETLGWMKHKLSSRLPGEIPITSGMQMTAPLGQKAKI